MIERMARPCSLGCSLGVLLVVLAAAHPAAAMAPREDTGERGAEVAAPGATVDAATAARLARLALDCADREYPNKIAHVLESDADVAPPRDLTPIFFGCYDWHSAVHGHWLLARLARTFPEAPFAADARVVLEAHLTPQRVAAEVRYLSRESRQTFERPYGLAWLLQLAAELAAWGETGNATAARWSATLGPLERLVASRFAGWLPKLSHPIRTGEHSQTAFAFGLLLDWARQRGVTELASLTEETSRRLYLDDRDCPLGYEPSGQDFLSPCLAEADLVRRLLPAPAYAAWLGSFLPGIPRTPEEAEDWLPVAVVTDPTDGKLAHLDGLNLSRAWMLEGMAAGLPTEDPRRPILEAAARRHRESGLASVTGEHYEGGHWLASFAAYLVTGRGLGP